MDSIIELSRLYSDKNIPYELNSIINSYLSPCDALRIENKLWKIETSHTRKIDSDITGYIHGEEVAEPLEDDPKFVKSWDYYLDLCIKTFVWENKYGHVDPDDVVILRTDILKTYEDITVVVLFSIKKRFFEFVHTYNQDTKQFSKYYRTEDVMFPEVQIDSDDMKLIRFDELIQKYHSSTISNEDGSQYKNDFDSLMEGDTYTHTPRKTCPNDILYFTEKIKEITLNRFTIRKILNLSKWVSYFSKWEENEHDIDDFLYEDKKFPNQIRVRGKNRRIMRIINHLFCEFKGDKSKVQHQLLRDVCEISIIEAAELNGIEYYELWNSRLSQYVSKHWFDKHIEEFIETENHDQVGEDHDDFNFPYVFL